MRRGIHSVVRQFDHFCEERCSTAFCSARLPLFCWSARLPAWSCTAAARPMGVPPRRSPRCRPKARFLTKAHRNRRGSPLRRSTSSRSARPGLRLLPGGPSREAELRVRDSDNIIGEVTADARGEWVLVPDQPIGPGDRLLSLEASSRGGDGIIKSDETVALSIAPAAPGKEGETALAVVLPRTAAERRGYCSGRMRHRPEDRARSRSTPCSTTGRAG